MALPARGRRVAGTNSSRTPVQCVKKTKKGSKKTKKAAQSENIYIGGGKFVRDDPSKYASKVT